MEGIRERTTRSAPCIFCGDVGYDMRMYYPEDDQVVHWCHKTHASRGDIISVDGQDYYCKCADKQIEIGSFDLFVPYLSKEEWRQKRKMLYPGWKQQNHRSRCTVFPQASAQCQPSQEPELLEGEEHVLSNAELDKIYRAFLSMLTLEEKHKEQLLKEWQGAVHDVSSLLTSWPIRSLPPIDKARFANGETFKNPTRKSIIAKLLRLFPTLKGVPGFYMRSGSYWSSRPEEERWTFLPLEGIIFPCFDKNGMLYRIRIKDDYPAMQIKRNLHEPYNGQYGNFSHSYDKEGRHIWTFHPEAGAKGTPSEPILVYGPGINRIGLKAGELPPGKPTGKYKNFSSFRESWNGAHAVNSLEGGSRSGSPYSIYTKPGDSFAVVIGTEGEKKGLVANQLKNMPAVTLPGVWCYEQLFVKKNGSSVIDFLKEKGMKAFLLCYDADKNENKDVKRAENSFIKKLADAGVDVLIGQWPYKFNKGLDDILLMGLEIMVKRP